ncbi:MAG: oligopeptide transporter, OPT family [Deltaproteobacteria bacterium]|nr:oligopeptide transporter, OPT family [Deltaproteobacteria bacterium]
MAEAEFKPYVDADTTMKEFTIAPLILGGIMAIVLGAANVYLGLKAGMTVAATFPAAVISMAVLRLFKGNILEENIARTTGAVGEALAAGAIFTIPAFILVGAWDDISILSPNWLLATALLTVGGVLGVLFVILLRRTFVEDATLPFPESAACTEIVKAGQGGASGAKHVFGSMGLAGLLEFFRNSSGIPIIGGHIKAAFGIGKGTFPFLTPAPSPAFLAVGWIIGPRYGAITASGGVFGWLFLTPIVLYTMGLSDPGFSETLAALVSAGDFQLLFEGYPKSHALYGQPIEGFKSFMGLSVLYGENIKIIAIGAMIVGAFFTLFNMRKNLIEGLVRSFKSIGGATGSTGDVKRTDKDLSIKMVFAAIGCMVVAMFALYWILCGSIPVSLIMTIVMAITGFLFAAVAGFLVSIIGSSSNPISGLTLSTLLIAAGLLVVFNMGGGYLDDGVTMSDKMRAGVLAVLGVATVVCCVAGVAGDMAQDWKVGYNLGGTPWKMEIGGIIGVIAAAFVLVAVITLLHNSDIASGGKGIGGEALPAPQAGLMATMAKGIISGQIAWELVIIGVCFAGGLILIGAPSPMLIAVGMYLPFQTVLAIFTGGIIKWFADAAVRRRGITDGKALEAVENRGLLIASGFVAGEALMGLLLASLVAAQVRLVAGPIVTGALAYLLGGAVIIGLAVFMISNSLRAAKS